MGKVFVNADVRRDCFLGRRGDGFWVKTDNDFSLLQSVWSGVGTKELATVKAWLE